jgi:tripartite ATP-independent transporter DctP family solute receptor
MKKTVILFALLSICAAFAAAQTAAFKLGHTMPPTHPSHATMLAASAEIAEKTRGAVKIDVFPAAQLGGAKDQIESTIRGSQDFAFDGPGVVSQFFPKISVLDMPFLFATYDEFLKVFNSGFGKEMKDELLGKTGLRVLDVCFYGSRQISSNKPIRNTADFKGFKIRVPQVQEPMETFKALGASPTPIAFGEVYFSLQTNVVDGQENPLTTIHAYKFYEVQKYITLSNHQIASLMVMVNDKRWKGFTEEQRGIISAAFRKHLEAYDKKLIEDDAALVETLRKTGVQILQFGNADREGIKKTVQQIYPKFEGKWGKGTVEKIQAVLEGKAK